MPKFLKNEQGVGHLLLALLLVVVVGGVAFAGWRVMSKPTTVATTTATNSVPAKLSSKSDVRAAVKALDETSLDGLNPDQLDSDLNSLL